MQTATKTISHYVVMSDTVPHGFITVDVTKRFEDALTYRTVHNLTDAEVWVIYADATSDRVA